MVETTTQAAKKAFIATEKGEKEEVQLMQFKNVKQRASPFINMQKSWEDEDQFPIPKDILKGIVEELGFIRPSNIQAVAIPMIIKQSEGEYVNLIAQSKNGSGKTGAFSIGSVLRIDPKIAKT